MLLFEANKRFEGEKADVDKENNMATIAPVSNDVPEGSGDGNNYPYVDPQIVQDLRLEMILVNSGNHEVR